MAREPRRSKTGKQVGILGDLPGPKLRIGDVDEGIVGLRPGSEIMLTTEDCVGSEERLSVSYDALPEAVTEGGLVYLADGRIRLRVIEAGDDEVRCAVEVGGRVASHQGLNLPGAEVGPAGGGPRGPRVGRLRDRAGRSTCWRSRSCAGPRTWRRSSGGCAPAAPTSR